MRYILFGDSIGFGAGDYENGGWATQLRLYIDRQQKSKEHTLTNLSIPGDTTRLLLDRMEREAKLRMRNKPVQEFTFLIAIGCNDSKVDQANVTKNISAEEFKSNLEELIKIARPLCSKIILLGLIPVDEAHTTPYKEQSYYTVARLAHYNQIIESVAKDQNLQFINFWPDWKGKEIESLFADGLHPNTTGHNIMFERIIKNL